MTLSLDERVTVNAAKKILRQRNRETRMKIAAARKPGGKASRGREIDTGYLQFLRRQPCCCCGSPAPSDAAHLRMASPERGKKPTGMQVKPSDRFAVPLNRTCHTVQHSGSEARFWSERGLDPFEIVDRLFAEYGGDTLRAQGSTQSAGEG